MQPDQPELDKSVRIEAYSLGEFCKLLEEKINQGYKVDFETNEGFPTSFGAYMTCKVVLKVQELSQDQAEVQKEVVTTEVKQEVKKGRPAKSV